jgi:hypothetical protein
MAGRMIQTYSLNEGQLTLNFSSLDKGKYFMKSEGNQIFDTSSLVIE